MDGIDAKETRISIHAPAKGATPLRDKAGRGMGISIHAPAKGATAQIIRVSFHVTDFNPRSREGSDSIRMK